MNTHVPATVEASFFRLLKLSAPSWLRIPGNISAISVKDQEKPIKNWPAQHGLAFIQMQKYVMSKQTIEKHNLVFSEAVLYYNQLGMH